MEEARWTAILSRIDPTDADDIDDIARAFEPRADEPGRDIFPEIAAVLPPRAAFARPDGVAIGLAVPGETGNVADRAMRLAAFAIERDVEVVILAGCDRSGFERFGFRVERIAGATEAARAACEEQIRRFWNIDLVL